MVSADLTEGLSSGFVAMWTALWDGIASCDTDQRAVSELGGGRVYVVLLSALIVLIVLFCQLVGLLSMVLISVQLCLELLCSVCPRQTVA